MLQAFLVVLLAIDIQKSSKAVVLKLTWVTILLQPLLPGPPAYPCDQSALKWSVAWRGTWRGLHGDGEPAPGAALTDLARVEPQLALPLHLIKAATSLGAMAANGPELQNV